MLEGDAARVPERSGFHSNSSACMVCFLGDLCYSVMSLSLRDTARDAEMAKRSRDARATTSDDTENIDEEP